ncbi:DeoR/GlpR family DNA-binding transcription regulator [Cryptosporangium aurantiacum]|uniref:Lactose phosphotransferase system repressor n=1 Tax=Cryptosporangium aurantiacum TaxID=134849 RepID=A0A1M7NR54_9ACTN|nr:DeoR/GlpR family DNA-binding transcription regulator [Cryptosporangium aurantiacum]SHN06532.1 transcriptional regulator, DeoR family [Cryptosporangium aurantiacum]
MVPEQRRQQIVTALGTRGMVRADDLANQLGVSLETIRRDLNELERRGELTRVYGGATRAPKRSESWERRVASRVPAKRAIARYAIRLLRPQQTVVFDMGTTIYEAAKALPADWVGSVLTTSGHVAQHLSDYPGVRVQLVPGQVREEELSVSGPEAEQVFAGGFSDVALVCAGGVHPQAGLTGCHEGEAAVRRHMIARSFERYVLADSSKLGRVSQYRVTDLSSITAVITDSEVTKDVLDALVARGLRVHVAPPVPVDQPA